MNEVNLVRGAAAKLLRENERLKRQNAELEATMEYIAMMTDVELPDPSDMEGEDEQEVSKG